MNTIVALLALGNPWRGDDALGLLLADAARHRAPRTVELRTRHLLGPEDVLVMEGAALALFVDASLHSGILDLSRLRPAAWDSVLRHGPSPAQALGWAELVLEHVPPAFQLAIAGIAFEAVVGLTPGAASHLEKALTFLNGLLAEPCAEHWMACCGSIT
jgi:Ni,Fe-hydrogenase maturation factor